MDSASSLDLQNLFFECVHQALRLRVKQKSDTRSSGRSAKGGASTSATRIAEHGTVQDKTEALMKFVTNKHVLQILYDVMFRFQKVQR